MDTLDLAIVGCGGMGTRHVYGVQELAALAREAPGLPSFRLAALCDRDERNMGILAGRGGGGPGGAPPDLHRA